MCDYSLMEFNNRLAVEGEVLVTHQFATGSVGFISEAQAQKPPMLGVVGRDCVNVKGYCAVCVPHGTRLELIQVENPYMPAQPLPNTWSMLRRWWPGAPTPATSAPVE